MRPQTLLILLLPAILGQAPAPGVDDPNESAAKAKREALRALYLADASSYAIYRDAARKEKLELRKEPAYVWTNPTRDSGQDGHVFVWTYKGRAEAVGTIFSLPSLGPRTVNHELHSLSTSVLTVDRPGPHDWKPTRPGVDLQPIPNAPPPAKSASTRLSQMRALLREFSASAVDANDRRWELRALPQPLYRYESTDPLVLDGAVFTLISSGGTDPELMIVIEARSMPGRPPEAATWQFGAARFTDMALSVKHKDKVVYQAPLFPFGTPNPDPTNRYHLFNDRTIPAVEETSSKREPASVAPPSRSEPKEKP